MGNSRAFKVPRNYSWHALREVQKAQELYLNTKTFRRGYFGEPLRIQAVSETGHDSTRTLMFSIEVAEDFLNFLFASSGPPM